MLSFGSFGADDLIQVGGVPLMCCCCLWLVVEVLLFLLLWLRLVTALTAHPQPLPLVQGSTNACRSHSAGPWVTLQQQWVSQSTAQAHAAQSCMSDLCVACMLLGSASTHHTLTITMYVPSPPPPPPPSSSPLVSSCHL
jgi:hypothetical protein